MKVNYEIMIMCAIVSAVVMSLHIYYLNALSLPLSFIIYMSPVIHIYHVWRSRHLRLMDAKFGPNIYNRSSNTIDTFITTSSTSTSDQTTLYYIMHEDVEILCYKRNIDLYTYLSVNIKDLNISYGYSDMINKPSISISLAHFAYDHSADKYIEVNNTPIINKCKFDSMISITDSTVYLKLHRDHYLVPKLTFHFDDASIDISTANIYIDETSPATITIKEI